MFKNIIILFILFTTNLYAHHLPKCPGEKRDLSTWVNCSGTDKGLDGHSYSGDFDEEGKYTGYGVLKFKGGIYEGEFFKDKYHGKGKLFLPHPKSNAWYEGEFFMGAWHGQGVLWSEDGTLRFDGEWVNGRPGGYGTRTADGKVITGKFDQDMTCIEDCKEK